MTTDYRINSSSIITQDSLGQANFDFHGLGLGVFNFVNSGFAFDVGANYSSGPFTISASVINIGSILWKLNPEQQISKGEYLFEGFEVSDFLRDTIAIFDSLSTLTGFEKNNSDYSTTLPFCIYSALNYQLENWSLGLMLGQEYYKNGLFPAGVFNVKRTFNNRHSLTLQYGIKRGSVLNLGFQGVFQIGPFQCFAGTDNIIGIIKPFDSNFSNMRFGVNLIIGQIKSE
jgi:hypothetical protein